MENRIKILIIIFTTTCIIPFYVLSQKGGKGNQANIPVLKALLVIVDDYSDPQNNLISTSVKRDFGTVSKLLEVLGNRQILQVEKQVIMGKSADLKTLTAAINALQCGPNDILFFYFSGHGGMRDGKNTVLFMRNGEELQRDKLESMLVQKNAKFNILITDACSNPVDGIRASRSLGTTINATDGRFDAIYKKLFLEPSGVLSLSASSPNEYAWSDDELGGYFTHYLINEGLLKNPAENWDQLFKSAKEKTMQMFGRMPDDQKRELAKEGVFSQTPKAYRLPAEKSDYQVIANNQDLPALQAVITNNSESDISYFIDMNKNPKEWDQKHLKEFKLKKNEKASISIPSVFCLKGTNDYRYYDINESVNFSIQKNRKGELELFFDDKGWGDGTSENRAEIQEILIGEWIWEDTQGQLTFVVKPKGKYHFVVEGVESQDGDWEYTPITDDDEQYDVLITTFTDENGFYNEYAYLLNYFDDRSLQLILFSAMRNGNEIKLDDFPESDLVIMLYKSK